jgi:hypothetical protein
MTICKKLTNLNSTNLKIQNTIKIEITQMLNNQAVSKIWRFEVI